MEGNGRRSSALMNPNLLEVAIPVAVALGALIYSVTRSRKNLEFEGSSTKNSLSTSETDSQKEFKDQEAYDSASLTSKEEEEEEEDGDDDEDGGRFIEHAQIMNSLGSFATHHSDLQEEIFRLMNRIDALQEREHELETRFVRFCELKERESVFINLQHMLELEIAHLEFLSNMVESMEAEKEILESLTLLFLRAVEQLDSARQENVFLEKKVKKLGRSARHQSRVLSQQASLLRDRDTELLRTHEETERGEEIIKKSQDEIMELKGIVNQLEEEKKELLKKLELADAPALSTSKIESEKKMIQDHNPLLAELEVLRKDRATKNEELIHLRWVNACLKHEFMRNQQQQIHDHDMGSPSESIFVGHDEKRMQKLLEYDSDDKLSSRAGNEHDQLPINVETGDHKKQKLLKKLRRWVKGNDECKRSSDVKLSKHEHERKLSISDASNEQQNATPRDSWASA